VASAIAATVAVPIAQTPVFRANVNLVRLQVLVTEDRRPVSGLTAADFEVRDSGARQDIEAVFAEPRPLDVMLVMDRSESLDGEPLVHLKGAAHETVNAARFDDRVGLIGFSQRVALEADLARDRDPLHRAIDGLRAEGLTSLIDALYGGLSVGFLPDRRSLILLFSDGLDNRSWTSAREVTARAQQSETIVDTVAYQPEWAPRGQPSQNSRPDLPFLRSLATDTGGEVVVVERPDQFSGAFAGLLERARSRYLITYYPTGGDRPGWHDVKVTVRSGKGTVTARRGYLVGTGSRRD
jgi:VWFA-related protein